MANRQPRIPHSYDEIVRRTVIDPDSSVRPTKAQEAGADDHVLDQERVLYGRLADVLLTDPSLGEIGFEVDRGRVTLIGSVRDMRTLQLIEDRARAVQGVEDVDNRLVVAP